jgi:guanylate kinase
MTCPTATNNPKIIIISGPSGSGKGTVISDLPCNYKKSVSVTTRDIRPDIETEGIDYFFISHDDFDCLNHNGEILEYNYFDGNYYGTPRSQITENLAKGYNVVLDVDVHGAVNIKKQYPEALMIFLMSPNVFVQEKRLRRREKNSEQSIKNRICEAANELGYTGLFDCVIINEEDKPDEAVKAVLSFVNEGISPDRIYIDNIIAGYFKNYVI